MVNSSVCLRRRVSNMSLVRICTVTITILRLFLCMCSRARHKERMRRREIGGSDHADEELDCGSIIESEKKRSVVAQLKRELIRRPFLTIKNQIVFSPIRKAISMKKLGPTVGTVRHQAIVDPIIRQVWEDRRFHQYLKRWLLRMWRSRKFCQQGEDNLSRLQSGACHQVMNSQILLGRKEFCEIGEKETTAKTVAWAESSESSYVFETPSCSHSLGEEKSIKRSPGFQVLEQTLKALLDDFLTKDEAGAFSYKECLAYFGDTCPCRFLLPNQIVGLDRGLRAAPPLAIRRPPAPPMSAHTELSFKSGVACQDVESGTHRGEIGNLCRTNGSDPNSS